MGYVKQGFWNNFGQWIPKRYVETGYHDEYLDRPSDFHGGYFNDRRETHVDNVSTNKHWRDFGILNHAWDDYRYLYIESTSGNVLKMAKSKYPNWPGKMSKARRMYGKTVRTATNKATGSWNNFFADIALKY